MRYPTRSAMVAAMLAVSLPAAGPAAANDDEHAHAAPLHFSHPLVTESPSPDTKVRGNYVWHSGGDEDVTVQELEAVVEYAFHPAFSVELDVPYVMVEPDEGSGEAAVGTSELNFKFANFAFARHGLLLGYGLAFGLPTGDDDKGIGSDHIVEIEPYYNFGYLSGALEIVGFVRFGIPTNLETGEEVENEMGTDLSFLYHFTPAVAGLFELNGETALNGAEEGTSVVTASPGIKAAPFADPAFRLGASYGVPVSEDKAFDQRILLSAFYHF